MLRLTVANTVFRCVGRTLIRDSDMACSDMASTTRDNRADGVEFIYEDDGRITARDLETGVASYGETKPEALVMLAEALSLHTGEGEPVTDETLREFGRDPENTDGESLPEFMQ